MRALRVRQSDLKLWARCPLQYKYSKIDLLAEDQGGSSVFGTVIHDVVLWMEINRDLQGALDRFHAMWHEPIVWLGHDKGHIDYYENGRSWKKFVELGPVILRNWWSIIQWDADLVIAREQFFDNVPIGKDGHVLTGTIDKLAVRYMPRLGQWVLLISDYKTNAKVPTYAYLEDDLQFTAYSYATTQPEFWTHVPDGAAVAAKVASYPRFGEWVQLQGPKRMECGLREQHHYNRLAMAVDALGASVAMRIFVPNISGESCRYCPFRKNCGLPEIEEAA